MPAKRKDIDVDEVVRRYRDGESSPAIAADYGVHENTILNRLNAAGLPRRRSGPHRKYDDAEVCRMYKDGMDIQDIQEKTGAKNSATFYGILKRNNVPLRLKRQKDDPNIQAQIVALRQDQELSQQAIGEIVGMNRNYVGKILRQEVAVERKQWQAQINVQKGMSIKEMRDAGATIDEIADIKQMDRVEVYKSFSNQ